MSQIEFTNLNFIQKGLLLEEKMPKADEVTNGDERTKRLRD